MALGAIALKPILRAIRRRKGQASPVESGLGLSPNPVPSGRGFSGESIPYAPAITLGVWLALVPKG